MIPMVEWALSRKAQGWTCIEEARWWSTVIPVSGSTALQNQYRRGSWLSGDLAVGGIKMCQ